MWRTARWSTVVLMCALAGCTTTHSADPPPRASTGSVATSSTASSTASTSSSSTTSTLVVEPHRVFPVQDATHSSFADEHHDYPAADIFTAKGCGAPLVAPVDGVVLEVNRTDDYRGGAGGPASRGGIYLSIRGNDGVRYYMAHFRSLEAFLAPGVPVSAGQLVGQMGRTGRAGACHLHFALSPVCPNPDWWVRRGAIWPQAYLRDWRRGIDTSPAVEVQQWSAAHPTVCSTPATN